MYIKQYLRKAKVKTMQFWQHKNVSLYFFFVIVATVFWFLHSLGKEYVANIDVDIHYQDFPVNKEPQGNVNRKHRLNVKAYGFSLMRMQLNTWFSSCNIDLSQLKVTPTSSKDKLRYNLSISAVRNQLEEQLGAGISINSIFPEDVSFQVQTMGLKNLPVRTNIKLAMQTGYMLEEKPKVTPDSVLVRGAIEVVDTLQAIYTKELVLSDVSSSFEREVDLALPNKNVELLPQTAVVKYEVGAYIDEERNVTVTPLNFPDSVNVVFHPTFVKLNYRAEVDRKREIKTSDFVLIVDYNTINNFSQKLEVQAISLPNGISKVHMTPRYVDYFISYKK